MHERAALPMRYTRLVSLVALVALAACSGEAPRLKLVTPVLPVDRSIAADLAELLGAASDVHIELTDEALAGADALEAVASGRADLALVTNNLPFREDLATIMPLYPTVLHIGWRPEGGTDFGPDALRGARIYAGPENSASRLMFARIAERTGLASDAFSYLDSAQDKPDIVILFAPISPDRVKEFPMRMTLASLGTPAEIGSGGIADAAVLMNSQFSTFIIPAGTYGEVTPKPVVTIAVDKILVTRRDLDRALVYDLVGQILRLRPAMAAHRPGLFRGLEEDFDVSRSGFVVHAGTQAFQQRAAPTVYERYSGIAEVVVTLIVALVSATFAVVRIFKLKRKNRIDRFYTRTIALQRSVTSTLTEPERESIAAEVRALQANAFDLLVDEKLAADESFRIFITLSNDVLRQLGACANHGAVDS